MNLVQVNTDLLILTNRNLLFKRRLITLWFVKSYKIAVVQGDGIGPEVVDESIRVLKYVQNGFRLDFTFLPFNADYYFKTKKLITDADIDDLKKFNAILLGAVGDPRVEPGVLEFGIVGKIRFGLDLYVNLRPIKLFADYLCPIKGKTTKDIDLVVVRENTEDCYRGETIFKDKTVIQEMFYTENGTRRIIDYAFTVAMKRKKFLTLVDKANAVKAHQIYRNMFSEISKKYPKVKTDASYVDAFCMWLVKNPEKIDTVVTTNMFGDIVTDLGAVIQGGLGIAAGGNIHPGKTSCFEPIHGSAPKYAGLKKACPYGCIMAGSMMLDFLGETHSARVIEDAMISMLNSRQISITSDSPYNTVQQTDMLLKTLETAIK